LSDVHIREFESVLPDNTRQKLWVPFGVHKTSTGAQFELDFPQESSGTQGAFVLLSRLLPALQNGGMAIIDEFENDLHPHMLGPILDLFASKTTNPHHAQLLFTCHAIEVLNILHKSQITLVEKDDNNESAAWRLDSVDGIRHDDNFYAKYMAGAYGAIPQL
jgi:predicted ATPase